MANAVATTETKTGVIKFVPLGSSEEIELSIDRVRRYLCPPTRNGTKPNDDDVVKFMMLCKARQLDPWVSDAYLVGYDGKDGAQFSLITSIQALLKRAELCPDYDGMESGVVVQTETQVEHREGDLVLDGEKLIGGWARVFRKNHNTPSFDSLKLSTYNTGRSRWAADPAGMIVKCAEASALRKAFPTQTGGLYTREEMDLQIESAPTQRKKLRTIPLSIAAETTPSEEPASGRVEPEPPKQQPADDVPSKVDLLAKLRAELAKFKTKDAIDQCEQDWLTDPGVVEQGIGGDVKIECKLAREKLASK